MTILTLGPQGSHSHEAATLFASKKKVAFASSIDELFFRLAEKEIDAGIVPIELADAFVEDAIAHLMKYDFSVIGKVTLPLHCHLAGEKGDATHLLGDAFSFATCRSFIHDQYAHLKKLTVPTVGHAAIQMKALIGKAIALVSPFAASYYDLPLLQENVEGEEENFATFFVVGKTPPKKKEKNGTAFLIFSEPLASNANRMADLVREKKIPLLKLKNLLLQEGHTPLYFMEVEGHIEERAVKELFEVLNEKFLIKHLGSYPL
ncbi:MAG: hypothetical protein KDK71_00590 [Chlamydiia bacterium]|nr:hypothetical protein [Chlamydiia bacterium]